MKKILEKVIVAAMCLGSFSLHANDSNINAELAKVGQSDVLQTDLPYDSLENIKKRAFHVDECENITISKSSNKSITTGVFYFQNIADGSGQQHVAVYADSVICTNISGPREGVQFIIMNNGALLDMCHYYTKHKKYSSHKYTWGEVNTYEDHQTVKFK